MTATINGSRCRTLECPKFYCIETQSGHCYEGCKQGEKTEYGLNTMKKCPKGLPVNIWRK